MQDMDEAEDEDAHHVEGEADEEHEEVAIVAAPCVVLVSSGWEKLLVRFVIISSVGNSCTILVSCVRCGTDAVVDPGAVVVEDLDAVVAYAAVAAPGRPVELTGHTPAVRYRPQSRCSAANHFILTVIPLISTLR